MSSDDFVKFKKFCYALRCPLCNSQLDGNIHPKKATLYCCQDNSEYKVHYYPRNEFPDMESITHYFSQYEYHNKYYKFQ